MPPLGSHFPAERPTAPPPKALLGPTRPGTPPTRATCGRNPYPDVRAIFRIPDTVVALRENGLTSGPPHGSGAVS